MIKLPAYFTGFSSKADGSAGLRFSTQEITAEEFATLKRELNNFGWLIFTGESEVEVPKEKPKDGRKTQAQRIRNILYKIHKQHGGQDEDAEWYYQKRTEQIIEQLKQELE